MKVRTMVAVGAAAAAVTAGAAVPAFAAQHAAAGGKISFQISESSVGAKSSGAVVIHGAVNAGGSDTSPDSGNYDQLKLEGGTLRAIHPNKDAKFSYKPNSKTCYVSITGSGTGTFGHGTGKYKGYTGSFSYKLVASGLAAKKKGACDFNGVGIAFATSVTGTGTLKAST